MGRKKTATYIIVQNSSYEITYYMYKYIRTACLCMNIDTHDTHDVRNSR